MEQCEIYCPYKQLSETTARGTVLAGRAGKEDPLKYYASFVLSAGRLGVAQGGARCKRGAPLKHPYQTSWRSNPSVSQKGDRGTTHGGAFGWGGTSIKG